MNKQINISRYFKLGLILVLLYLIIINLLGLKENYAAWMTYKDFDTSSNAAKTNTSKIKNFIYYLSPGLKDTTTNKKYSFSKVHWQVLGSVFLILFPLMFSLRLLALSKITKGYKKALQSGLMLKRVYIQSTVFMIARLGVLRVSGACPVKRSSLGVLPFMNCQSCELAVGGCPIGTLQMSLLNKSFPALSISVVLMFGLIFGRFVCGWLCPFGFLSDIFSRFSKHNKLPKWIHKIKFYFLALFALSLILLYHFPKISYLPFCSFACPSGFFYGKLPFYLTNGLPSIMKSAPYFHIMFLLQISLALIFIALVRKYTGRIFCIAVCPLGTIFSLFNKIALFRIVLDNSKCNSCGKCSSACPMQRDPVKENFISKSSCISCGSCVKVCKSDALNFSINFQTDKCNTQIKKAKILSCTNKNSTSKITKKTNNKSSDNCATILNNQTISKNKLSNLKTLALKQTDTFIFENKSDRKFPKNNINRDSNKGLIRLK